MKRSKVELDVDFIGSQEALTQEEEKALMEYFRKRKQDLQKAKISLRSTVSKRPKTTIQK